MQKIEYLFKRLFLALIVLLSVSVITFLIARVLPSDPAAAWVGAHPTPEQIERATIDLGLDQPLTVQYFRYMRSVFQGDLGDSIRTHQPITTDLKTYLPATLELVLSGMFLAIVVGIPLGVLSGTYKGSWMDHLTRLISIGGVSLPSFWLGLLLQLLFFGLLGWLPVGGRVSNAIALNDPITQITGFYLLDALLTGNWAAFKDVLLHLILPAFTLATYPVALTIRMTRSTMIEVLNEKYILAAKISGLPKRTILFSLALKNAIIPTITVLGLSFVYSLTGSLLTEIVFSWPGLGTYVTDAVLSIDFPVIVSVTLVITVFYVFINLFLDLLQSALDPRISLQ
jgi:peptide/nickel transport system permease protein